MDLFSDYLNPLNSKKYLQLHTHDGSFTVHFYSYMAENKL